VAYITGKYPKNNDKIESEVGVCWGTKEQEHCYCDGDKKKCDFYPEVIEKAKQEELLQKLYKQYEINIK